MKKIIATILTMAMALVILVTPASAQTNDPLEDFMWEQLTILLELGLELDLCESETSKIVCTYPVSADNLVDGEYNYSISRQEGTVNISIDQTGLKVSYHQNG